MSRIGKIARLPLSVRSKLNCRLEDGESHRALLRWLNELPEVKEILAREFEGKRINDPNLTAWSQGGFAEWQLRRELVEEAQQVDETVMEFREERKERCGSRKESALQNLGLSLGFRYAGVIAEYDRDPLSESLVKKVKVLRTVTHGVVALQLAECASARVIMGTKKKMFGVRSAECGIGDHTPASTTPQVLPHGSMGASALPMGDKEKQKESSHAGAITIPQVLPHGSMGDEEKKFGVWSSEFGVFGGEPGSFRTGHQTPPLYGARDAYHYHWGTQSAEFEVRNFEKGSFTTECGVVGGDGRKSIFQNESSMRTSGQQKNLSPQSSAAELTIPFTLPQLSTAGCLPHCPTICVI